MKKQTKYMIAVILLILAMYLYRIFLLSRLTMQTEEVYDLKDKITKLQVQNSELQSQILEASSLVHIYEEARKMGFRDNVSQYYYLEGGEL